MELLPLEPPELSVAVVNDVNVDRSDGDVKRSRDAARTARWSPTTSSSSDDGVDELRLRPDKVLLCRRRAPIEGSSRESATFLRFEELLLELGFDPCLLLTTLVADDLVDRRGLSICLSLEVRIGAIVVSMRGSCFPM